MVTKSQQAALQVVQQAIAALAKWAKFDHPTLDNEYPEVKRAKEILGWNENTDVGILRLLFDKVNLCDLPKTETPEPNYHPLQAISNDNSEYPDIPYPLDLKSVEQQQTAFIKEIQDTALPYLQNNWGNLSLLMLILEKFGSCLSFGESDVALVDMTRTTAAVAAALVNNSESENIALIAGDLSGIQKFIYTISSGGALKSLRARSFYLELVTEEIVQQLLEELELPRTSIIYAGGGNLYLLAPASEATQEKVKKIQQNFNRWLIRKFQGKVFLALGYIEFPTEDIAKSKFTDYWQKIGDQLNIQKQSKFDNQIYRLIGRRKSYSDRCQVCHRDDTKHLDKLNKLEDDSVLACSTCRDMFQLGDKLFNVGAIVRSSQKSIEGANPVHRIDFELSKENAEDCHYYHLFTGSKPIVTNSETAFLINNWKLDNYKFKSFKKEVVPLLLGNYGKNNQEEERFIRSEEMAEAATGINRVGYLRMDVDKLGQIFAKGLGENQTLPRLAGLSRQMSYFFKVYLNSLADNRYDNFIQYRQNKAVELLQNAKYLTNKERDDLLFIYAGGDDLFVTGAWDQIVEFAFDVYQSFRAFTGYNKYITLSGGISIEDTKFPIYQAAQSSGNAEDAAKANGRDSLGLFGNSFKWSEWIGLENANPQNIEILDEETKQYLGLISNQQEKLLFGVFPFVERLEKNKAYNRSFIHNLLETAQIQDLMIKDMEDKDKKQQYENHLKDIRYYLHLPKIAYTLARLPKDVLKDEAFRTSLKSPYNAPYFRAIATWIELLNRAQNYDTNI